MFTARARQYLIAGFASLLLVLVLSGFSRGDSVSATVAAPPPVQLSAPLAVGDVAVTGFSGATLATPTIPAGVDPLTETVIDPNGVSLRIFDLSTLGGPTVGQVVDAPVKLAVPASQIGQVFGLAFDDGGGQGGTGVPNLYVAASSAYGLQIVGGAGAAGGAVRLKQGAPGARFMDGQFGGLPGGSPGAIFKIDGTTGAATFIADTAFSGVPDSGPGIGNLAFDPASRNLYASDLDTGLIHRFDLNSNAADLGQFDHGMSGRPGAGLPSVADDGRTANIADPGFNPADPSTWGFTQPERRVEALAVHDGRLYYSVADGPTIWSVALGADGSFDTTARLELAVKAAQPFAVTDIAFDPQGRMILAQRGPLQSPFDYGQFTTPPAAAETLRYTPATPGGGTTDLWAPDPDEFPIGFPDGSRQGDGGVTLTNSYNPDGTLGSLCEATLITTGDDLRDNPALTDAPPGIANLHGIQLNDASLVGAANTPPLLSAFVQFDPNQTNPQATGHIGDVEAVPCTASPAAQTGAAASSPGAAQTVPVPAPPAIAPAGTTAAPPNNPATAGLTLTKVPAATSCTADGGCAFSIIVNNPGPDPVPGPFTIDDVFTAGGAGLAGATLAGAPNPPWTCETVAPALTCTDPGPLAVGDTTLSLTFTPGPLGAATDVVNCVRPDDPANPQINLAPAPAVAPAANVAPGTNADAQITQQFEPQQCATIPITPTTNPNGAGTTTNANPGGGGITSPTETVDGLTWQKQGPATCTDTGDCTFTIHVKNPTNQTINGPIQVQETLSSQGLFPTGTVISTPASAPWTCVPSPGVAAAFNCANPNSLAAGASADFTIGFKFNSGQPIKDIKNCIFPKDANQPLCVDIPTPGNAGTVNNANPAGGGVVSAPQTVGGITWKKEGPATCTDTAECAFKIDVANNTNQAINGPITLKETLSSAQTATGTALFPTGTVISTPASAPWTCTPTAGSPASFDCTDPNSLAAGANADFTIGFKFNSGQAVKDINNCIFPAGADKPLCVDVPTPGNTVPAPGNTANTQPTPGEGVGTTPNGLSIIKRALSTTCSDTGGGCTFNIDLKNTGTTAFDGPIDLTDVMTTGDGKPLPAASLEGGVAVTVASGTVVVPSINCGPGTNGSFACSTPPTAPAKVPPGGLVTMQFTFKPGASNGASSVKNCVSMQGGPQNVCASIPLSNGPLLRAHKSTVSTTCVTNCFFHVSIENVGNAPFTGVVSFVDTFSEANPNLAFSSIAGKLTCPRPVNGAALCSSNTSVTLQPGEAISDEIIVTGATLTQFYTNCLVIPGPIDVDNTSNDRCANITDKTPVPAVPQLKFAKSAPGAGADGVGTCTLFDRCVFPMVITNTGTVPFVGSIIFTDQVSGAVQLVQPQTLDPNWVCLTKNNTDQSGCIINTLNLAPGAQAGFLIAVVPGPLWAKNDTLQNCIIVNFKNNATLDPTSQLCASVKLDPFNVVVTKSGDQSCAAGGDCNFTLTLKDPGPIDHDAPVTLTDNFSGGTAPITSIEPPLPCATQPTQVPFTCTSPGNFPLTVGEKIDYHITIQLPATATSFQNCAEVGPNVGNKPDAAQELAELGSPTSCVSTIVTPPTSPGTGGINPSLQPQTPATQAPSAPTPPQPGNGGTNPSLQPQTPATQAPAAAIPQQPTTGGSNPSEQPAACFSNMVPDGPGNCACPANTFWNGSQCVPGDGGINKVSPAQSQPQQQVIHVCPTGTVGTFPNCRPFTGGISTTQSQGCGPGTHPSRSGRSCLPNTTQQQVIHVCPTGTVGTFPNCRPFTGGISTTQSQGCGPSTHPSRSGRSCLPNATQQQVIHVCPTGTVGTFPNCRPFTGGISTTQSQGCGPGTHPSRSGRSCLPNTAQQQPAQQPRQFCTNGMIGTPPNCQCPQGTRFSRFTRSCTADNSNTSFPNGPFQRRPPFRPRFPSAPTQTPAPVQTPVPVQQPSTRICPPGERPEGHRCIGFRLHPGTTTTPAPTPAAPAATDNGPVDFGGCPGCGGDIVVK